MTGSWTVSTTLLALLIVPAVVKGTFIPRHETTQIGMPVPPALLRNFQQAGILEQQAERASEKVALAELAMVDLDTKYRINMHQAEIEEAKKHPDWKKVESYGKLAQEIQDSKILLTEHLEEYILEETTIITGVQEQMTELWKERAAMMVVLHSNVLDWDMSGWIVRPMAGATSHDNIKAYHGKENVATSRTVDKDDSDFFVSVGGYGRIRGRFGGPGSASTGRSRTSCCSRDNTTHLVTIRSRAHLKNQLRLVPVFSKTQAIPVWNQMFEDDRFGAVGVEPAQLFKVYCQAKKADSENKIALVTGARYMALFYGTVHVTQYGTQSESQEMASTIDKLESALKTDYLMTSFEMGGGYENSKAQQIVNGLSKTIHYEDVTVQYFAHTFGVLVELQTDVMKTAAASRKSAEPDCSQADRKNKVLTGIIDVVARVTMEPETHALEISGAGALMHAFKMFKARVAAADETVGQLEGVPYQYAVTSYGKADIASIMLQKYHADWMTEHAEELLSVPC